MAYVTHTMTWGTKMWYPQIPQWCRIALQFWDGKFEIRKHKELHLIWLVVSNIVYFPFHIWDVILPIWQIFVRGVGQPPTSHVGRSSKIDRWISSIWNPCGLHLGWQPRLRLQGSEVPRWQRQSWVGPLRANHILLIGGLEHLDYFSIIHGLS